MFGEKLRERRRIECRLSSSVQRGESERGGWVTEGSVTPCSNPDNSGNRRHLGSNWLHNATTGFLIWFLLVSQS
jgi:hypothetical protein